MQAIDHNSFLYADLLDPSPFDKESSAETMYMHVYTHTQIYRVQVAAKNECGPGPSSTATGRTGIHSNSCITPLLLIPVITKGNM